MNNNIDFAFLVHPRNMKDIYRKYPSAKYVPQFLVTFFLKFIGPVPVARINGIKPTKGLIISLPITAEYMLKEKAEAKKKVVQAIKYAKKRGAKIIGLGSLTSPVVGGGVDVAGRYGVRITNGNALTAYMTMGGIKESADKLGINLSESTVAVVGATGSIGQAVSKLLVRDYEVAELVVIGRTPENVDALRAEIKKINPNANIVARTDMNIVSTADVVVVATSASGAIMGSEHLKKDALVYDITQPQNVPESIREERPDVVVVDGAIVQLPEGVSFKFNLGIPPQTTFACMAETIILAAENLNYDSVGKVTIDQVENISSSPQTCGTYPIKPIGVRYRLQMVHTQTRLVLGL